jgi:hypothetical protein
MGMDWTMTRILSMKPNMSEEMSEMIMMTCEQRMGQRGGILQLEEVVHFIQNCLENSTKNSICLFDRILVTKNLRK